MSNRTHQLDRMIRAFELVERLGWCQPATSRGCSTWRNVMFDVPNLDTMDEAELLEFYLTADRLCMYAYLKREAMLSRAAGRVQHALEMEAHCQNLYEKLPDWARW